MNIIRLYFKTIYTMVAIMNTLTDIGRKTEIATQVTSWNRIWLEEDRPCSTSMHSRTPTAIKKISVVILQPSPLIIKFQL